MHANFCRAFVPGNPLSNGSEPVFMRMYQLHSTIGCQNRWASKLLEAAPVLVLDLWHIDIGCFPSSAGNKYALLCNIHLSSGFLKSWNEVI